MDSDEDEAMSLAQHSAVIAPDVIPHDRGSRRRPHRPTGRPRDAIWDNFNRSDEHKPHATATCKHCHERIENGKPNDNLLVHLVHHCQPFDKAARRSLVHNRGHMKALVNYRAPYQRRVQAQATQANQTTNAQPAPRLAAATVATVEPDFEPATSLIVDQDEFELELARVFILCALSFVLVDSPVFQRFFQRLVPQFKLPSRKDIAGKLLDSLYLECMEMVKARIRQQAIVSIVADFWTNVKRSSILNVVVVSPGMPSLLWKSTATGTASHNATYVSSALGSSIDEIQSETSAFVVSVGGDNASNMIAGMNDIEKTRPMFATGCPAHVMNLLIQDTCKIPLVAHVKAKAVAITVYVLGHHPLLEHFANLRDPLPHHHALVTPVPTRWYSVPCCLKSILTNKSVLKKLFNPSLGDVTGRELLARLSTKADSRAKLAKLRGYVNDWEFWSNLKDIDELFDPLVDTLRQLEADGTCASHVYEEFRLLLANEVYRAPDTPYPTASGNSDDGDDDFDLESEDAVVLDDDEDTRDGIISDDEDDDNDAEEDSGSDVAEDRDPDNLSLKARFYKAIDTRWKFVHTDAMGIAYLLDPSMDLAGFVDNDQEDSIQQARAYAKRSGMLEDLGVSEGVFLAALYKFAKIKGKIKPEARALLRETPPSDWWSAQKFTHPLLVDLADRIFAIPTSSAACERSFSIQDFIHRKKRNRLSNAKAAKLTYCYINFGTLWRDPLDMARVQSYPGACSLEDEDLNEDRQSPSLRIQLPSQLTQ